MHPMGQDGPVAEFLKKNPNGGIHHVSFAVWFLTILICTTAHPQWFIRLIYRKSVSQVDNINSAAGYIGEAGEGILPIDTPNIGARYKSELFLQPKDNMGVLIKLQQITNRSHSRVWLLQCWIRHACRGDRWNKQLTLSATWWMLCQDRLHGHGRSLPTPRAVVAADRSYLSLLLSSIDKVSSILQVRMMNHSMSWMHSRQAFKLKHLHAGWKIWLYSVQ